MQPNKALSRLSHLGDHLSIVPSMDISSPLCTSATSNAIGKVSPITTHVLDTARGKPAAGLPIKLFKLNEGNGEWKEISAPNKVTNNDGRITDLWHADLLQPGVFKMWFDTNTYFNKTDTDTFFYPYVEVIFQITDTQSHYHVPLLLSPFGFSTYRGS
jgi:5-hydroxyisourate hydrolase